jgi:hypothetical protein
MKYIDKIKEFFFTKEDLGIRFPDDYNAELFTQNNLIAEGARSQMLMSNPIFQESVAEMYMALESQLDSIDDTMKDAQQYVQWVRVQRRALRQVCAMLDNKIAAKEAAERALQTPTDEV